MSNALHSLDQTEPAGKEADTSVVTVNDQDSSAEKVSASSVSKRRGGRKQRATPGQESTSRGALQPGNPGMDGYLSPDGSRITLKLSQIVADPAIQSRAGLNTETVQEYAERLKAGDLFPPLQVFEINNELVLGGGFHTFEAARQAGVQEIPAMVHKGSRKDAIKFSVQANTDHGLPRTNEDKRRAAGLALQEFPDLSDGSIAVLIKVSQPFVTKIRHELKAVVSSETRIGRDGKKRKTPQRKTRLDRTLADEDLQQTIGSADELQQNSPGAGNEIVNEGDCPAAAEAEGLEEFEQTAAWALIEEFLRGELVKWPESSHKVLAGKLRDFADRECL